MPRPRDGGAKGMNELKPCPFCGGNALIQVVRDLDTGGYYSHYIFCDDCGAEMSAKHEHESVIEKWNKRAEILAEKEGE